MISTRACNANPNRIKQTIDVGVTKCKKNKRGSSIHMYNNKVCGTVEHMVLYNRDRLQLLTVHYHGRRL